LLSQDADFQIAKEFIVQGLAVKIGNNTMTKNDEITINTRPREAIVVNQAKHPEDYAVDEIIDPEQKADLAQIKALDDAQR
jgi:hypothetical protein